MSLTIEEKITRNIVRVVCGSESGTAFFISPNTLLTARHVVSEALLYSQPVEIYYNDKVIIGQATQLAPPGIKIDVAIIELSTGLSELSGLKLLSANLNKHQKLLTIGYPLELAGCTYPFRIDIEYFQTLGKSVPLELLVKTSNVSFFSYSGYSGAPLLNSSGSVVGILTLQENQNLKALSIKTLRPYLETKSVQVYENDLFEDDSPTGLMRCREKLDYSIRKAGTKYDPEVHQTNTKLQEELERFIDGKAETEYENALNNALIWCNNNPTVLGCAFSHGSSNEKDVFKYLYELEQTYYDQRSDRKLPLGFKKEDAGIDLKENLDLLRTRKNDAEFRIFGLFGVAGCGKSHTSLWFAENALNKGHHIYHCFGTDFTIDDTVNDQLKRILNLTDDDLREIDTNAATRRTKVLFIIDAINEGVGYSYWKYNLLPFLTFLRRYAHFKLFITGRQANDGIADLLYEMREPNYVRSYELDGFSVNEIEEAKEKYAKKYNFPLSRFNNLSVDFSNPLILQTFCKGQASRFRFGSLKISKLSIYSDYLSSRNIRVSKLTDVDPKREITLEAVKRIAAYSVYHKSFDNLKRKEAYKICNRLVNRSEWSKNLLYHLIQENILSEHHEYFPYEDQLIDFEFQNIGDTFRGKALFDSKMDVDSLINFINDIHKRKDGNKENIIHAFVSLFGIWDLSVRPELSIDIIRKFKPSFLSEVLKERGQLNPIIEQVWLENIDTFTIRGILLNSRYLTTQFIDQFHEHIKALPLPERDFRNIEEINRIYETHRRDFYSFINATKVVDSASAYKYCLYCCWLGSTSHPDFRAVLKREVAKVIYLCPDICVKLLIQFIQVNDPYVEEIILCSIYGALLLLRNSELSTQVARIIEGKFYGEIGDYPRNLLVRQWAEQIIEYAKSLNPDLIIDVNRNRKSTPNPLEWNYSSVSIKNIFGNTKGGKYLRHRLFRNNPTGLDSDFNRYILGTNNDVYDRFLLNQDEEKISLDDIANMIAIEIRHLGWNDSIGEIDTTDPPFDRYGNETEKISKKYLWIAYYNVMALLSDHCKFNYGEYIWDRTLPPIDNPSPWMLREASKFDPTLLISLPTFEECLKLSFSPDFSKIEYYLENVEVFPTPILEKEENGTKWILVDGWDGKSINTDDYHRMGNIHYQYISWVIKEADIEAVKEQIRGKDYYDMPNISENRYNHLWNEYPWAEKSKYGNYEWSEIGIEKTLAMPVSIVQLQEDFAGIDYENQPMSSAYCPNWEMMKELRLYTAERGIIRNLIDMSVAAFNRNCTEVSCGGLIFRQDILDKYLSHIEGYLLMRIEYYKSASEPERFSRREYEWLLYSPGRGFEVIVPRYSTES